MAYIQSTINARSCCVMCLSFSCSQSFHLFRLFFFFSCVEKIPENVLVDNYWRFHTTNCNSRKSNFYDSHAQREMTLASSGNNRILWWLWRWGGSDAPAPLFRVCWSQISFLFGVGGGGVGEGGPMPGRWRTAEPSAGTPQQESDSASPHNLGLAV